MPTEPTIRKSTHDLALLIASNVCAAQLSKSVEEYFLDNKEDVVPAICRGFVLPESVVVETSKLQIPDLTKTGKTFADWLEAREKIHFFLTGEVIKLREIFEIPEEFLIRTDIMPAFRPVGATNREALDWKVKLGMKASFEEVGVEEYKDNTGPTKPQLLGIARSVRPDQDTLVNNAKSPIDLRKIKIKEDELWCNLFSYSDADNLHFLILGRHLDDEETWTWFIDTVLLGGRVAGGRWLAGSARAGFLWSYAYGCRPGIGARLARAFSLKTS